MAQVTVELRDLLKTDFVLFDFDYNFDDKKFAKELEQHVIDYYYTYEIGQEVPEYFKHEFRTRWRRKIGGYNEMYNLTLLDYNPLINYSMDEVLEQLSTANSTQDNTVNTKGNSKVNSTDNTKNSDYPQQPIAGDYLSGENLTKSDSTMTDDNNTTGKTTDNRTNNTEYTKKIEGLTGTSYQELIKKQRDLILPIIDMVIEEMKPCFILVY